MEDGVFEEHKVHLVGRGIVVILELRLKSLEQLALVTDFFVDTARVKLQNITELNFGRAKDVVLLDAGLEVAREHLHGLVDEPFSVVIVSETVHEDAGDLVDPKSCGHVWV